MVHIVVVVVVASARSLLGWSRSVVVVEGIHSPAPGHTRYSTPGYIIAVAVVVAIGPLGAAARWSIVVVLRGARSTDLPSSGGRWRPSCGLGVIQPVLEEIVDPLQDLKVNY